MKPRLHYLVTLELPPNQRMHAYVMSNDKDAALGAGHRMLDEIEKLGGHVWMPLFMVTPLTGAHIKTVREVFSMVSPEVAKTIKAATTQHLSIVGMLAGSPPDKTLMELH